MATQLKIKRRTADATAPSGLTAGELAVNTVDNKLYVGNGSGNIIYLDSTAVVTSVNGATGAISNVAVTTTALSQFAATTSAQLAGVINDETGTGALVFATSPTLVTPVLGTPSSGTLTNCTFPTLNQNTTGTAATVTTAAQPAITSLGTLTSLTVSDSSLTPVKITSTDAGAAAGPDFILDRFSATIANNDIIGRHVFRARSTGIGGGTVDYATIEAKIMESDAEGGTNSRLIFKTHSGGALSEKISITDSTTASSTTVATVVVTGGLGVSGNVHVGGTITATSPAITTSITTPSTTFSIANTTATTGNLFGAATTLTVGATTGTAAIRNPTTRLGNTTSTIDTNSAGGTNHLTLAPFGEVRLTPTSSSTFGGSRPSLTLSVSDGGLGTVAVSGGDLYLGIKTDDMEVVSAVNIVFEGATDNAHETTLTVADPTADRTITLPNASGTVALTNGFESMFLLMGG